MTFSYFWFFSVDDFVKEQLRQLESKKIADGRLKRDECTVEQAVTEGNERMTLSSLSGFPVAAIHPEKRPNPACAADGRRPSCLSDDCKLSAPALPDSLSRSITGQGNICMAMTENLPDRVESGHFETHEKM